MQSSHADPTVGNQDNDSHASSSNTNTNRLKATTSLTHSTHQNSHQPKMENTTKFARTVQENREIKSESAVKRAAFPTMNFSSEITAVARRNERERNRVRLVNEGFNCLRQRIPFIPEKKKLSKVETLRYAVAYIKHLQCVIQEHDAKILGRTMERRRIKYGVVRMVSTKGQER